MELFQLTVELIGLAGVLGLAAVKINTLLGRPTNG